MAYCTRQDMVDRFGEQELIDLTDRGTPPLGIIDSAVLDGAISDASAEIDGYLAGRYELPLASVPSVLKRIACDLARYHLYDDAASEHVAKRYDDAIRFLRAVGRGEISLGVDAAGAEPQVVNGAEVQSGGRVFSRDDDGYI